MSSTPTTLMTAAAPRAPSGRAWLPRLTRWLAEARSHRVVCLVLGIWLLNGFDLAFTVLSHEQGVLHEANPVARQLLENGPASIILFKIGLVLIGSYPLLRFRTVRITEMATALIFVAYVTLAIRWSVCYDFYATVVHHSVSMTDIANVNGASP